MNIEGLQARGTRTTLTYAAAEIGSQQPFSVVNEVWYSSDLRAILISKPGDPRSGDVTYRLTGINAMNLRLQSFRVPSGYTVRPGPGADAQNCSFSDLNLPRGFVYGRNRRERKGNPGEARRSRRRKWDRRADCRDCSDWRDSEC